MSIDKTVIDDEVIKSLQDLYNITNKLDVYSRLNPNGRDKLSKAKSILIKLGRIKSES